VTKVLAVAGLLVLASSVSAAMPTGSAPSFAPARNYATGRAAVSVAIGDLNGDGKLDLATANANYGGAGTVSVLLNRGEGSFRAKVDYRTGRTPASVAIGDLNGDGKPDLVAANSSNHTVSVLLNRGDGSFQAKVDYRTGPTPLSAAIGDLNGDGKPDLVAANYSNDTVSVLLNTGNGSFQASRSYATGFKPQSVAIGELTGDGKPDLAIADYGGSVSVLLNRGDGSFQAKRDYGAASPLSVAIGDLNGDGKADLATAGSDKEVPSTVTVLLNRGNGSFQASRSYTAGPGPQSVTVGDLNGDGKPDLATGNSPSTVSVLVNRGGGSFRTRLAYAAGGHSIATGDLNGDGKLDLATAGGNKVSVLLNTPGLCTVQNVKGQSLPTAKRTTARANCRVGRIRRAYSRVKRGRVTSQRPTFGAVLPGGGKVNLVVSRGRRSS
jgi:FG-GAP-like repeat/FG-GAP repeat/PASTA domain